MAWRIWKDFQGKLRSLGLNPGHDAVMIEVEEVNRARRVTPAVTGPSQRCLMCDLPQPGPHRGTCMMSLMHGGPGVGTVVDLMDEIERLRARTHEIQAAEMEKRREMESRMAQFENAYARGRELTAGWTAEWTSDTEHPWWSMTSINNRTEVMALIRDAQVGAAFRSAGDADWPTGEGNDFDTTKLE